MKVRAKEHAVSQVMFVRVFVRSYVSRLQGGLCVATRDGTATAVGIKQSRPELGLAAALIDLRYDSISFCYCFGTIGCRTTTFQQLFKPVLDRPLDCSEALRVEGPFPIWMLLAEEVQ